MHLVFWLKNATRIRISENKTHLHLMYAHKRAFYISRNEKKKKESKCYHMCPVQSLLIHKRWRCRRTKTFRRHFSIVADSCSIINYDKSWWCSLCFRSSLHGFPPDKAMQFQEILYLLWMYSLPKIHHRRAWGSRGWSMRPSTVNFRVYWSTTWHNFSSQN